MNQTSMGIAILLEALLLVAGPAQAQALVSRSDCQAEQAAMRRLGAPEAAVGEALLPPGTESAEAGVEMLAGMRDTYKSTLSIAQASGAKQDAATFRLTICAYNVVIARKQRATSMRTEMASKASEKTQPKAAAAAPVTTHSGRPPVTGFTPPPVQR